MNAIGFERWKRGRGVSPLFPASLCAGVVLLLAGLGLFATGCSSASARRGEPPVAARFYLEAAAGEASVPLVLPHSGVRVRVGPRPVLTEYDLSNAELAEVELGQGILFEFTTPAAGALYRLTTAHPGRRLVLLLDGEPTAARPIDAPISDGRLLVFVERAKGELPRLVGRLKRSVRELEQAVSKNS